MTTDVDTNILLDLLVPDSAFAGGSAARISEAARLTSLVVCEPVLAELSAQFLEERDLFTFLAATGVQLRPSTPPTLTYAGAVWRQYVRRRPAGLQCTKCGHLQDIVCASCGSRIRSRQHIVADFIIGAHASMQADALLTRDRGFYRTYFPDLALA